MLWILISDVGFVGILIWFLISDVGVDFVGMLISDFDLDFDKSGILV